MRVTLKLYAKLQDYLPESARTTNALPLDLEEGTTIGQVIVRFGLPEKSCHLVLIDGNFIPPAERHGRALLEGQTLAIWPPVAGG